MWLTFLRVNMVSVENMRIANSPAKTKDQWYGNSSHSTLVPRPARIDQVPPATATFQSTQVTISGSLNGSVTRHSRAVSHSSAPIPAIDPQP